MATMNNYHKLKVGFRVNPNEEKDFYFTSTLEENRIVIDITTAFELGRAYVVGDMAINMGDVSWFRLEWVSCCE